MEQSEVHFGQTAIAYTIHRGRRQKTVAVAVDPLDGVSVRAPHSTPVEELDNIVHRKARWILDKRLKQEDLPPPPSPREFVSGETFLYLGRQYRLKLERATRAPARCVRLIGGWLHVPAAPGAEAVRDLLVAWYRAHAARRLPERVPAWAPLLGVEPTNVLIRDQRKRWGSADGAGVIRLNWRVVQAPMRLVDYVVVHELVHLRYPDHTRDFWAALGGVMGDYEARREGLRRLGRAMVW